MKLVKSYNNITIESALTKDTIKKAMKHCPTALEFKTGDPKKTVFAIEDAPNGAIFGAGIRFDNATAAGNLFVTVTDKDVPADPEKAKAYLEDTYGPVLIKLGRVEAQITEALAALATEIDAVADSIVIG